MVAILIAASVLMVQAGAQPPKQYDSIAVFEHCTKIERDVRLHIVSWQVETPKAKLIESVKGDRAQIAIINDIYDGPARGRTKSEIVRKWVDRCVGDPVAFGFKP